MQSSKAFFKDFVRSILNSYAQVFFSKNWVFALILVIITFFNIWAGVSGLLAVLVSNAIAWLIGFNRYNIKSGYYGFNSLLVALGIGIYYQPNLEFFFLIIFASLLTLFITIAIEGILSKYNLPFLSLSFLLSIWLVTLASRQFKSLNISPSGIYELNDMYRLGGMHMVKIFNWLNNIPIHESIIIYFRSLGAIFFQYHLFAGILVAIGVLIYSRIAFLLSLIGFFSAYFFYLFIGANIQELSYSYIGYNFILTSIAIGGLFMIPSKYSFLWVVLLTPVISILITSTTTFFGMFQLSIFSLPFNIIVLTFLYIMKFRERSLTKPEFVMFQQFSPERNLYTQLNNIERFYRSTEHGERGSFFPLSLPFWGEWTVTQAHNGEFTHKDDWRHAWDFEIKNDDNLTYKDEGINNEDYFCYNKPVIAPADGTVELIVDDVEDNAVGDVNLEQNWGNTVIIKHAEFLYTKLCHLKKSTFKVSKGSIVKKGDIIAYSGNSGRSPEPHLHYQVQINPFIGSKTLDYPLDHYISHNNNSFELKELAKPAKDDIVSNIKKTALLSKAFHFIPGQQLSFNVNLKSKIINRKSKIDWEVQTDIYNNSYILCKSTNSKAYFKNTGNIHYFTHYEGNRNALLYYFYLASYKLLLGFYKGLKVHDIYPLHIYKFTHYHIFKFLQDFISPFYMFIKANYTCENIYIDDEISTNNIKLSSMTELKLANRTIKKIDFTFDITEKGIAKFTVLDANNQLEATINTNEPLNQ